MIKNISSVQDFTSDKQLVLAFEKQAEDLTEKKLVQKAFDMGYTIRLGAIKEILSEIKTIHA